MKLTAEPKFVQKRRQLTDSKDTYEDVSTSRMRYNNKMHLVHALVEIFGIFYSFPLAMTIEQEGNEVVFFLLSFSDLSHHRMCGPAKKHSRTPGSLYI